MPIAVGMRRGFDQRGERVLCPHSSGNERSSPKLRANPIPRTTAHRAMKDKTIPDSNEQKRSAFMALSLEVFATGVLL
jgi:hypothetical protein